MRRKRRSGGEEGGEGEGWISKLICIEWMQALGQVRRGIQAARSSPSWTKQRSKYFTNLFFY